ncbi:TPA: helix-turn-helix transcriptional regulator [Clostridium botulinum]|uniref:helix-turn-helix transcriptional regulator n=1 Tax=Clostridium botulinum TaxID=1491 RepID=UPI000D0DB87E|nr:helix-turn-helix transcriptional regulator [Clostridium botulinum]PSL96321.1 transcriptional regulator [Clostridium botulinum]HDK7140039.1 helix-turn-helix transcriptional regulator [Clostridium botulinum]HDK7143627.1 helix-turn-helix transcriptional regulator [Clostridium botulinum]HDK7147273.1 helix-turn-helix transcriptional regulator [Clostridium botulinum]HDK7151015.1 helix-turn-helix transcriptional regulator [Clostridium botulinum]
MGLKIKFKRMEKGFTQQELADKVRISRYYLSAIERDKAKNPSITVMKKIAELLETPVQELFFEG